MVVVIVVMAVVLSFLFLLLLLLLLLLSIAVIVVVVCTHTNCTLMYLVGPIGPSSVKKQAMGQVRIIASLNLAPEIKLEGSDLNNFSL